MYYSIDNWRKGMYVCMYASLYNRTASTWTLATLRTTWQYEPDVSTVYHFSSMTPAARETFLPVKAQALEEEPANTQDIATKEFFTKVGEIQARIQEVEADQRKLRQLHEDSKTAVQNEKTKQIRRDMAATTDHVKTLAKIIKGELDHLDALNERYLKTPVRLIDTR